MSAAEDQLAFQLRALALPEPVREFRFDHGCCGHSMKYHPALRLRVCNVCAAEGIPHEQTVKAPRRWRFDFAYPALKVALEVDGGSFVGGRHVRGAGYEADLEKYNAATVQGWRVLRFTPAQIEDGTAMATIEEALKP